MYNESGILPNFLGLYHNGRELDKNETVESASILAGDVIVCEEIDRIDMSIDDDPEVEQERGFGGTALTGRISECNSFIPGLFQIEEGSWLMQV